MSETINIAEVASRISKEIFRVFRWHTHPRKDDNFPCTDKSHKSGGRGKSKDQHPTDVVFSYQDPYSAKRVHLLCDLKSYKGESITSASIRKALQSLAMSVECAAYSDVWKERFAVAADEDHAVHGLLFVHNHDGLYKKKFKEEVGKVKVRGLEIRDGVLLHYLGPDDIDRLFNIASDITNLIGRGEISKSYSFYYPDLIMSRRVGDVWDQQATFEVLAGPFVILKYPPDSGNQGGHIIYYNRSGKTREEFEYLIDCLSRFQLLDLGGEISIRMSSPEINDEFKSKFALAARKYAIQWGMDEDRAKRLESISIDRVNLYINSYNPGDCGWR
ncbi:hypothetical protein J3U96_19475 [Stenotrophomonas maltophilia]|nr:hypothetical protein J3U96_19475 [Stenotrophomonas maltophilia]